MLTELLHLLESYPRPKTLVNTCYSKWIKMVGLLVGLVFSFALIFRVVIRTHHSLRIISKGSVRFTLAAEWNTWVTRPALWSCFSKWSSSHTWKILNYTSIDPKQFTVSKFRLKPVILICECFCSRRGHTNQHPPPTWRGTTGDNGRQDHFRAQEADHTNQHPPPTWRETTGDKTTSEPKKPTTPTNTHPPHEGRQPETMGDNGRQDHFRAQEADHTNQHPPPHEGRQPETTGDNGRQRETRPLQNPRSRPHQPTPTPHEGRQPETTGDKTTSEPKMAATPTNTHPPHEGRQ